MVHSFADTQRDRYQVSDQRCPEAQGDGHRHFLQDQVGDRGTTEKALAEIQLSVTGQHQPQALVRGLVETVLFFDVLDQLRIEAAASPGGGHGLARTAADTGAANALQVRDRLFHRPARRGLDDNEVDQKNDH
ncbi:hypothetical protein D3C87_1311850 [compost metagenome]